MNLTLVVKEISSLPAGRALDRRLGKAIGWKCERHKCRPELCPNVPKWSTRADYALDLRSRMAVLGWSSSDEYNDKGWAEGFGYSVWFQKWATPFTGKRWTSSGSSPRGVVDVALVTARAALLALERPEDIES